MWLEKKERGKRRREESGGGENYQLIKETGS
jgi:hypothetical protein